MTIFSNTFGLAIRNFTTYPDMPDPQALIAYAVEAEGLGFDSVWCGTTFSWVSIPLFRSSTR